MSARALCDGVAVFATVEELEAISVRLQLRRQLRQMLQVAAATLVVVVERHHRNAVLERARLVVTLRKQTGGISHNLL